MIPEDLLVIDFGDEISRITKSLIDDPAFKKKASGKTTKYTGATKPLKTGQKVKFFDKTGTVTGSTKTDTGETLYNVKLKDGKDIKTLYVEKPQQPSRHQPTRQRNTKKTCTPTVKNKQPIIPPKHIKGSKQHPPVYSLKNSSVAPARRVTLSPRTKE